MAMLLWPPVSTSLVLLLQVLLLCLGPMTWPCVEQNLPGTHLPLIANINWLMQRFDLVSLLGDGQPVAFLRVPPPVVTDDAMLSVFRSAMEARIFLYWSGSHPR